jgi:sterol desaturase/sphingolipid hydroxylase (fatty acid hydroxylase superfamily)
VKVWIHTETVRRLPAPLEWLLNTPSHHRVHHGKNTRCLARNHGGVLIIGDRRFGSFAAEDEREPVRYGITHAHGSDVRSRPLPGFDQLSWQIGLRGRGGSKITRRAHPRGRLSRIE